tara:strand:- start:101 stop:484 length:384 start_codon:yes stop_codon:yes gene_type:complete
LHQLRHIHLSHATDFAYNSIFRYAGTGMMKTLVRAFAIYSVVIGFAFAVAGMDGVPRTIGLIQPVVFFILVGFSRMSGRYLMVEILNDLIAHLLDCRDPKLAVTTLKSLVPEFDHGRDNDDNLEEAS